MNAANPLWERAQAAERRAWFAFASALLLLAYCVFVLLELGQLESGAREQVRTFDWAIGLYEAFGRTGVLLGFLVPISISGVTGALAVIERRKLVARMEPVEFRAAVRQEREGVPDWSQVTDRDGRIPARTWVWLAALLLLIAAVFLGVKSGLIE